MRPPLFVFHFGHLTASSEIRREAFVFVPRFVSVRERQARLFLRAKRRASIDRRGEWGKAMFRVRGENRQDRQYHVSLIWNVYKEDVGAAIILAATYFEWCIRRCILALGATPVSDLRTTMNNPGMNTDGLKDLWKSEVCLQHSDICALPDVFDSQRPKQVFDGTKLTWQNIGRARKARNDLVHGARCEPLEAHGKKHVEIFIAASDILIKLAENHGRSIFKIIKRGVKKAESSAK